MTILHTIYHSGFGHTKLQAQSVHHGASSVAECRPIYGLSRKRSPEAYGRRIAEITVRWVKGKSV